MRNKLSFEMELVRVRASFSNIPLWHALMDDLDMVSEHLRGGGPGMFPTPVHVLAHRGRQGVMHREPCSLEQLGWGFRATVHEIEVATRDVSLILCNDKPTSFGAPDVLQANVEELGLSYLAARK